MRNRTHATPLQLGCKQKKRWANVTVRKAHSWSLFTVKCQQWHPMRTALLFRLGPVLPAPQLARLLDCHVSTLRRKANKYGIQLFQCLRAIEPWEIKFMRANRGIMSQKEIADALGRSEDTVRTTMRTHGLQPGRPFGERHAFCRYGKNEVELARQLSDAGLTARAIAEKMELQERTVRGWVNFERRKHFEGEA